MQFPTNLHTVGGASNLPKYFKSHSYFNASHNMSLKRYYNYINHHIKVAVIDLECV